jgi:hypothetical protein
MEFDDEEGAHCFRCGDPVPGTKLGEDCVDCRKVRADAIARGESLTPESATNDHSTTD